MNQEKNQASTIWTAKEIAKMAVVTSLYVVITITFSVFSFGVIQVRLSEMFNYLALYNKRYIWAVTLGVALANIASPQGIIDVVVGSVCTLLVLLINQRLTRNISKMSHKMVVTALVFAFSMFTVAGQLTFLYDAPFFANWLIIGVGELLSMTIGGIMIYWVGKRIDLTK